MGAEAPVVIVGAGALGSLMAARLAQAGVSVVLVGRAAQVAAIAESGLRLQEAAVEAEGRGAEAFAQRPGRSGIGNNDGNEPNEPHEPSARETRLAVTATTDMRAVAQAALVLLCVKSDDTAAAALALAAHLPPAVPLLSLQNGVANAPLLAQVLQRPVLAGVAYIAAAAPAPGVVRHSGGRSIVMGRVQGQSAQDATAAQAPATGDIDAPPDAALALAAQRLQRAGFDVRLSSAPMTELWRKLVVNCACNAISALAQAPYGLMATLPAVQDLQAAVVREAVAVACAESHALAVDELLAAVQRVAASMPGQRSSTAQDLARGRRSEIDHLNGEVVRAGARHGIATPANQALWALVRLHEAMAASAR